MVSDCCSQVAARYSNARARVLVRPGSLGMLTDGGANSDMILGVSFSRFRFSYMADVVYMVVTATAVNIVNAAALD